MNKENKKLLAFGYGLALLIPFFILARMWAWKINSFPFLMSFIFILVVISNLESKKWLYYLTLTVNYYFLFIKSGPHKLSSVALIFLILANLILVITLFKVESLRPFYNLWMKVATFIGEKVTIFILTIFYYFVFGIFGLILKIIGKDLLSQKIDRQAKSYWLARENSMFDKSHYKRQF